MEFMALQIFCLFSLFGKKILITLDSWEKKAYSNWRQIHFDVCFFFFFFFLHFHLKNCKRLHMKRERTQYSINTILYTDSHS